MKDNHQRVVYYAVREEFPTVVKIGTTVNLPHRFEELRRKYGTSLTILGVEKDYGSNENILELESKRHFEFRADRIIGEWFWVTPEVHAHISNLNHEDLEEVLP